MQDVKYEAPVSSSPLTGPASQPSSQPAMALKTLGGDNTLAAAAENKDAAMKMSAARAMMYGATPDAGPSTMPSMKFVDSARISRVIRDDVISKGQYRDAATKTVEQLTAGGKNAIGAMQILSEANSPAMTNAMSNALQTVGTYEGMVNQTRMSKWLSQQEQLSASMRSDLDAAMNMPGGDEKQIMTLMDNILNKYAQRGLSPEKVPYQRMASIMAMKYASAGAYYSSGDALQKGIESSTKTLSSYMDQFNRNVKLAQSSAFRLGNADTEGTVTKSVLKLVDGGPDDEYKKLGFSSGTFAGLACAVKHASPVNDSTSSKIVQALTTADPAGTLGAMVKGGQVAPEFAHARLMAVRDWLRDAVVFEKIDEQQFRKLSTVLHTMLNNPMVDAHYQSSISAIVDIVQNFDIPEPMKKAIVDSIGSKEIGAAATTGKIGTALNRAGPAIRQLFSSLDPLSVKTLGVEAVGNLGGYIARLHSEWMPEAQLGSIDYMGEVGEDGEFIPASNIDGQLSPVTSLDMGNKPTPASPQGVPAPQPGGGPLPVPNSGSVETSPQQPSPGGSYGG